MRSKPRLATKLLAFGAGLLLVALASCGVTLWLTWKLEGGAAAVNEAGRLRMNMLRMVLALRSDPPALLHARSRNFEASLELLRRGDPQRPLFVAWDEQTRARFDLLRSQWAQARSTWLRAPAQTRTQEAQALAQADAFVHQVDGFVSAIENRLSGWTAALHLLQLALMVLAIAAAAAFIAVSYLLVINPVTRLQQAQARLGQGALDTRLPVDSGDEFGALAAGFNRMAQALQAAHGELEHKVRAKTARIAEHNQRLEALYEVSAQAAAATDLAALAQGFVRQIRRVAGADAAALRWSDEGNRRYLLLASDGLPQALTEAEHCLHTGACLCGQPQAAARTRVLALGPGGTPAALAHCRAAGFATLLSIPVHMQQRLLGEVDLLFRAPTDLGAELRALLEAMTQHLASAMEGLRAQALEREAAVSRERDLLARTLHDSLAQTLAFLKIHTRLLRDALAQGDPCASARSLAELEAGVRECDGDVRELLVHWRTRTSAEDIEPALRSTLSKFAQQSGIATTLRISGHGLPLAQDLQIQVLHMVQEALSNVRKHAQATRVQLTVRRHPRWRFTVRDNGRGFDPAAAPGALQVGLGIMRERAQCLGARLQLESAPGQGTCVCIELPEQTGAPAAAAGAAPVRRAAPCASAARGASGAGLGRSGAAAEPVCAPRTIVAAAASAPLRRQPA